jgi:hypothetical protein
MSAGNPAAGPPYGLPVYRVLTGPDDAAFCHRVSEALALGYVLRVARRYLQRRARDRCTGSGLARILKRLEQSLP